jgi:alpha-D-ribose 1-methylphosphonate 5-triphosphate synthase subunit PhnH
MTTVAELPTKYAEKVLSAQSVFRAVMDAMARPGRVQRVAPVTEASASAPAPMMRGTAGIAITLFDHDTPVWLDDAMAANRDVGKWLKFHAGAPVVEDSSIASFALVGDAAQLIGFDRFALGSGEYPDRSTTLILQVASVTDGAAFDLSGPGIDGTMTLRATLQPSDLIERLAVNHQLFPRGVDLILVADDAIVALPRTTRMIAKES